MTDLEYLDANEKIEKLSSNPINIFNHQYSRSVILAQVPFRFNFFNGFNWSIDCAGYINKWCKSSIIQNIQFSLLPYGQINF